MKPTLEGLIALFRRNDGQWINHAVLVEAGGHRYTARVMELRAMGFGIEQRSNNEASQYRMTHDPLKPRYATVACPACLWRGTEPQAIGGGSRCPKCGADTVLERALVVTQEALFA